MKKTDSTSVFFDETTKILFCIHRAYFFGFITRQGMTEICEMLCIETGRTGRK